MRNPPRIDRRTFVKIGAASLGAWPFRGTPLEALAGETLYNGIMLPSPWPPRRRFADNHPITPPYLADPPTVVPIDVGRQLFVDDFLIEETTLGRTFHRPTYHDANPVLRPETDWEKRNEYADRTNTAQNHTAMVFSDGVFFDPQDRMFKMWYMGGYRENTCLVVSRDGIRWERPAFDYRPGTNVVMSGGRDSGTVWLDHFAANPAERYKMALFISESLNLHVSPDGVHWKLMGATGAAGDRSTFFYNPFRRVWAFGLRASEDTLGGRFRQYWENADFAAASGWKGMQPVAWVKADSKDFTRPELARIPELYNLDCVGYESLMLGLFTIWRGESATREKINEVTVGFSRDGFHWDRPDRRAFLPVSETPGAWNYANVQSAGGCCLVVGDRLHFYVSGRAGEPGTGDPGTCTTGLATLRRDGFASMDWLPDEPGTVRRIRSGSSGGELTTRPLRFSGQHLFVNADLGTGGELRVEVLDREGRVIAPFQREACVPVRGNGTRLPVAWSAAADLQHVTGRDVRFRFQMTSGRLYAFWVSPWSTGESRGYMAAGGPEFSGPVDAR